MPKSSDGFRDTLQLPQTDFPMRAGLPQREPEWLQRWEQIGIYARLRSRAKGRPVFVLHDGPPYANGHLHIGHALNKILKDMVVRSQQMMGKDSRYVPGWDCHGLPIEWKVEEQYRDRHAAKDDVPIVALRAECRRFAEKWIDIQRDEFRRLGITGCWDDPYLTMDFHAEAVIAEEFMKLLMNGSLYRGFKPVLWSTVEKTALAEAEVEYHDHKSDVVWVQFPIISQAGASDLTDNQTSVLIWTTTPWTLPSNRAICYNPDVSYGLYEVTEVAEDNWLQPETRLLIADNLSESCMEKARVGSCSRLRSCAKEELAQLVCSHPFRGLVSADQSEGNRWDYPVPLLAGAHVTDTDGTGFVHTAPSHGVDDYRIGMAHGLDVPDNVQEDGSFRPDLPLFGGHSIFREKGKTGSANDTVITALRRANCLAARETMTHSYPHSWRSKAPLIYRSTPQWFAAIDRSLGDGMDQYGKTIRERALKLIDSQVQWTPPTGRNRLYAMIEQRPDWVLSRQRAWGVPLTCFTRIGAEPEDEDFFLKDDKVNQRIVAAFLEDGADAWFQPGAKERFLGDDYDPASYSQVFDILDVWFDSGSTHAFVLRDRNDGPEDGIADLYLEGTDQHRGWFHSSLLQACGTRGEAPYRGVLTHGFTLDEHGRKMSKSLGNTIAPEDIVRQNGADILRLWTAQSDYRVDLRIGPEILRGVTDSYRRIRNCFRFMLGNLFDFVPGDNVPFVELPGLERWVLHRVCVIEGNVRDAYSAYDFQRVFQAVFDFANTDLSSFYFDIRKDTLYCEAAGSRKRRSVQTVLDILHQHLCTWLAPILAFTAEEVWLARFPGDDSSVHLQDFPPVPEEWRDQKLADEWGIVRDARRVVTACLEFQRRDKIIGSSLESCPTVIVSDPDTCALLERFELDDICITSGMNLINDQTPRRGAVSIPEVPGIWVEHAPAEGKKCDRCWKFFTNLAQRAQGSVCARCAQVLDEHGGA